MRSQPVTGTINWILAMDRQVHGTYFHNFLISSYKDSQNWLIMQHEFGEELCTDLNWEPAAMVKTQITATLREKGIQVSMFEYQTHLNFINYCCWWDIKDTNSVWPGNREKKDHNEYRALRNGEMAGRREGSPGNWRSSESESILPNLGNVEGSW